MKYYKDMTDKEKKEADEKFETSLLLDKRFAQDIMSWYDGLPKEDRDKLKEELV